MRLTDSRRLTGPSLYLESPGAVLDAAVDEAERSLLIAAWEKHARRLLRELSWPVELSTRCFEGGVSLALAAPVDGLYTATEVNEAAFDAARDWIEGNQHHLLLRAARQLRGEYRDEERPRLQRLLAAAAEQGKAVLLDEEAITLGTGCYSQTFDLYELPHPDDLRWSRFRAVPSALVTGTNGKTTTVRLLGAIIRAHGKTPGISSTDWLAVGDELIEKDDFAGPAGARRVLRDSRVEMAVLETARGGLLRRGLAVQRADVAVITNIAADHLGDYGVHTIDDLADVKWSVTRALDTRSTLVINAEDPLLMQRLRQSSASVILFALNPRTPGFAAHVQRGGVGYTVHRGRIARWQADKRESLVAVKAIPITHGGLARHNIANALAASAAAEGLRIPAGSISEGLRALRNEDNPGRANLYTVNGVTVLLDFAHNPAGLTALLPVIESLPAQRRCLVTGQAGDRSDADIRAFADATASLRFDRVIIKQMDGHARGRAPGEVATLLNEAFAAQGYPKRAITRANTELDATRAALRWARAGDLIVLLAHENKDQTRAMLDDLTGTGNSSCT